VGLACTMFTLKVADSLGIMAIANVCQVCGCVHGTELAVTTPLKSFTPAQHSGVFTQAALAPVTDAAAQGRGPAASHCSKQSGYLVVTSR
jgi:hypothetical protein